MLAPAPAQASDSLIGSSAKPVLSLSGGDYKPWRRAALCLFMIFLGVRGVFVNITIAPTCPVEGVDVCGNGQNGQNNAQSSVSMWDCSTDELTVLQYITSISGLRQVGFGSNIEPSGNCQLYGCAAHQCLKTTTRCGTGIPDVSYECVGGADIVDLQPFMTFTLLGFMIAGVAMWVSGWPELTTTRIAGILMLVYISYNFAAQITVEKSCPWGDQTYSECNTALPGVAVANQSQVVQLYDCNRAAGVSPFATHMPRASYDINQCALYSCEASQCLKSTKDCATGAQSYECVAGQGSASVPPTVLFFDIGLLLFAIYFIYRSNASVTVATLIAMACIVYGFHNMALSMSFIKGCDYSDQTTSFCGTGENGQVSNPAVVTVSPCFELDGFTNFPTPFTTNLKPVDQCLQLGCGTNHCLKRSQQCSNGFPSGPITTECVVGRGIGGAAPVAMFFYLFLASFGVLLMAAQKLGKGVGLLNFFDGFGR